MSDSLKILKELALQIRNATVIGENTPERVGRTLVGIIENLEEEVFVEMLKRYIDNKTILWNDKEKYIYSLGGVGGTTYTIAVGIDASSVGKCTVEATGDVVSVTPSADKGIYTIVTSEGGTVKVSLIAEKGYQIKTLNVDKAPVGAVSEYTFDKLDADHTMFVWLEVSDVVPTEYLVRSDLPGMYYSSTQDVLNALKASYPDGLTTDVTVSCIKPVKESRRSSNWIALLSNWNLGTMYTLTIDGANRLSYNGKSLGCLYLENVDNVVLENIDFLNFSNHIEQGSPDEMSAIMYLGDSKRYACNFYLDNCRFNGISPLNANALGQYNVIAKYAENIYMVNCNMTNCHGVSLKMVDCKLLTLVKNYIKSDWSYNNLIGHPSLCSMSNGHAIICEDNTFTGTAGEYLFSLANIDHIIFRRNSFKDGGGEAINISSRTPVKELVIESNLFANMLALPTVSYAMHYIMFTCNVEKLIVNNNTAYMSGTFWQQWFLRAQNTHVGTMRFYNNLIITATESVVRSIAMGKIGDLKSGYNIYQVKLKNPSQSMETFFVAEGVTGGNSILALQSQGYEIGTNLVGLDETLLEVQNNGTTHSLTSTADALYPGNDGYTPDIDVSYKSKAVSGNSRGCYNLAGSAINEIFDVTTGYKGLDFSENKSFANAARYTTNADNVLLLRSNSLNRYKRFKLRVIGTQHQFLVLGRCGLIYPMPELDENGEYTEDELYTVKIE